MQAVVFVLPVSTVPSLHVALVVSGVTAFSTFLAAFFVPVAVSFAASSVTWPVFFAPFGDGLSGVFPGLARRLRRFLGFLPGTLRLIGRCRLRERSCSDSERKHTGDRGMFE